MNSIIASNTDTGTIKYVEEVQASSTVVVLDRFTQTTTEEVYQASNSFINNGTSGNQNSVNRCILIEHLKGWTKAKEIVLNFSIELSNSTLNNVTSDIQKYIWSDFGILNFMNEMIIKIGENGQQLGRQCVSTLDMIKLHMSELSQDDDGIISQLLYQLGLPLNITHPQVCGNSCGSHHNIGTVLGARWESFANMMRLVPLYAFGAGDSSVNATKRVTLNLAVPLYFFNSFFNSDIMLPPQLKLEITLNSKNYPAIIAYNIAEKTKYTVSLTQPIRMIYLQNTYSDSYEDQIISSRVDTPLIYNYETYETYYQYHNDGLNLNFDIAISQQRPTQITLSPITRNTFIDDKTITDAITANSTVNFPSSLTSPYLAFTDAGNWDEISIAFNGRTDYRLRNDVNAPYGDVIGNILPNGYEVLFKMIQKEQYKDSRSIYSTHGPFILADGMNRLTNQHMVLTLVPGMLIDRGQIHNNQDSVMIRVNIRFTKINTNKDMQWRISKKLHEQLAINYDNTCSINMWPVLRNNKGYFIQNTQNAQ